MSETALVTSWDVVPISSTKVRFTLKCTNRCLWTLKIYDETDSQTPIVQFNNYYTSSGEVSKDITVPNRLLDVTLRVKEDGERNNREFTGRISSIDMRLPTVSATLTPLTASTSTLKLTSDIPGLYTVRQRDSEEILFRGAVLTNQTVTTEVKILRNTLNYYAITVSRVNYDFLSTTVNTYSDNRTPVLSIVDVNTVLNTATFKVSADKRCRDWKYRILDAKTGSTLRSGNLRSSTNSQEEFSVHLINLPLDVPIHIEVSAVNEYNGITGVTSSDCITCEGSVRLRQGTELKSTVAYVYARLGNSNFKSWQPAIPCVCVGTDDAGKPIWKSSIDLRGRT